MMSIADATPLAAVKTEMRAIISDAERADRELTGAEITRFDRLKRERDALMVASALADKTLPGVPAAPARISRIGHLAGRLEGNLRWDRDRRNGALTGKGTVIGGYAAIFDAISRPALKGGRSLTRAGAFDLAGPIVLCRDHRPGQPFASTRSGTLRVWQDATGLAFEANISTEGASLLAAIAAGSHTAMSVAGPSRTGSFVTVAGERVAVITRAAVSEISVVATGACPDSMCWLAGTDPRSLPSAGRALFQKWQIGRPR